MLYGNPSNEDDLKKKEKKKSIRGALSLVSPALLRSAKNKVFVRYDACLRFDIISSAFL